MTSDESSDLIAIKSSKMLNHVCYFVHYNLDEKYWTNEACLLLSLMLFMNRSLRNPTIRTSHGEVYLPCGLFVP